MASDPPTSNGAASASGADEQEKLRRICDFLEHLHNTPLNFEDERYAPEVDREALVALVRGQLPAEQERFIYKLVYTFKNWCDAHDEVMTEELRERPSENG